MTVLSARLSAIADLCPPGRTVADIGSDHALLPLALLRSGRAPRVIAVDLSPGPVAQLRALAHRHAGLEARAGDGLAPLRPGEAATLVLAGMGGRLIARILSAAPAVVAAAERLILQPNEDLMWLRGALAELGVALVDQRFTVERGRCFFTDAWAPTAAPPPSLSGADALVGPVLLAAPSEGLREGLRTFLRDEEARLQAILEKVGQLRPEGAARLAAVRAARGRIDGVA